MTQEQINAIPQEIKALPRWVGYMLLWNEKKGKNDKIPINPYSLWGASSINSKTWSSFEQALAVIGKTAQCYRTQGKEKVIVKGTINGVGFVLGDGYCGIDIDHCVDSNWNLSAKANDIVSIMNGTYCEFSISGTGIHQIFKGTIPVGRNKSKDNTVEMYSTGRYFIVTGNGSGGIEERTGEAAQVFKKYMQTDQPTVIPTMPHDTATPDSILNESDDDLLAKMFSSKNGGSIAALWDGNTSEYGDDDSRADSALIMHLLFWTHGDTVRTDKLFRQSCLMRPKWDEMHGAQTYGELTIQKAAAARATLAIRQDFAGITIKHPNKSVGLDNSNTSNQPQQDGIIIINPLTDEHRYGWNDMGVGALFADTYKNMARYVPEAESWYVYDGGVWKLDTGGLRVAEYAKALVRHMITCAAGIADDDKREKYMKFVTKMNGNRMRNAMLESAKSIYPITLSVFDKNPYLFNCLNGTFDLQYFKLLPHHASDFLSKIANVEYRPGVTCTRWDDFVDEIMEGDTEKATYLQTAIGYGLTGLQNQKCFFILHGQKTNNGKSTFMDTVMHIMGDYAKAAQADLITSKQFARDSSAPSEDVARLWGARLVSMAEPDKSARLNVGLIKQLTGNDPVTARFLRQNSFQFVPEFKIFLHANDLPQTTDDTIFSSGRIKVIEFNREFKPEEQDKTLTTDFRQSENASGIFNWMLEGTHMFLCQGLHDPISIQAAIAAYRAESDVVGTFIDDCLKPDPSLNELVTIVYQKYQTWCSTCGYQPLSLKNLTRELRRKLEIKHGRNGNFIAGYSIDNTYFARRDFPISYN